MTQPVMSEVTSNDSENEEFLWNLPWCKALLIFGYLDIWISGP